MDDLHDIDDEGWECDRDEGGEPDVLWLFDMDADLGAIADIAIIKDLVAVLEKPKDPRRQVPQ